MYLFALLFSCYQIDACSFSMTFVGYGYDKVDNERTDKKPNKIVTTQVVGPGTVVVK